ncbi:unnamed protein product, partial [Chrysoparadoxa australica]
LHSGNNIEVTSSLDEYVRKKVAKTLDKVGSGVTKVDVHLQVDKNPRIDTGHSAEVTVFSKGAVIRATEHSESMYASIDLVTDRIARKLRQHKEKTVSSKRHRPSTGEVAGVMEETDEEDFEDITAA